MEEIAVYKSKSPFTKSFSIMCTEVISFVFMEKISAIIVDDEQRARRVLRSLLAKTCPQVEVVADCASVLEAVEKIEELKPHLVFLDVQMPNYAGYEIVNFFSEMYFKIIFVTAFDQYALKAFELCAIDYLLKPVKRLRLVESVKRLEVELKKQNQLEQYQLLLDSLQTKRLEKIVIPELQNRRVIDVESIIAIEANGAYTKLYLNELPSLTVSKNLKYFENRLSQNNRFFRTHRGWIINVDYLDFFNKTEHTLLLKNGIKAKISRSRFLQFRLHLGEGN